MPKVSVIIPVYNSEKYLRQCLDSVVKQTLKDIEIICVDDGSTDSSKEILEEYAQRDKRIIVVNQKNSYAGVARNNGIKIAKGDYIHFLDSDDWIKRNTYKYLYKQMVKKNVDVIIFQHNKFNIITRKQKKPRRVLEKNNQISNIEENPDFFITNELVVPWNKFYNRKFIIDNDLKFDQIIASNDRSFYIQTILAAKKIMVSKKDLIYYRMGNMDSLAGEIRNKKYECHFDSYESIKKYCENQPIHIKKKIIDITLCDFLYFYYKSYGKYREEIYEKLHEYFQTMDVSLCETDSHKYYWWDEYMAIKNGDREKVEMYYGKRRIKSQHQISGECRKKIIKRFIDYLKKNGFKMTIRKIFTVIGNKLKK